MRTIVDSDRMPRALLLAIALVLLVSPVAGQGTVIEPCPVIPAPTKPGLNAPVNPVKVETRARKTVVDSSVPEDTAVETMLSAYKDKVRVLSIVIGRLEGDLRKVGVGAGSLGNFVTDGMRTQAQLKLGKPVVLAIMNAGGLRKNEISAGPLRASDIFELLPFENSLMAIEVTGVQLSKLLQIVIRDAQAGARIKFRWNEQNRAELVSAKLVDERGHEQEIERDKLYTVVTIDYLLKLASGAYVILQEAKSTTPLNITLRDAITNYVKAETSAGRRLRARLDDRFVQIGPDPIRPERPND